MVRPKNPGRTYKPRTVRKSAHRLRPNPRVGRIRNKVHFFKRTFNSQLTITGSDVNVGKQFTFRLSDLQGYTEFTDLFDMYKICAVKIEIIPVFNSIDGHVQTTTLQTVCPPVISVLDYNDNNVITSEADMLEYESHKMTLGWKKHTRYLKPKCQTYVKELTNAAAMPKRSYLSTEFADVDHYGAKVLFLPTGTMADQTGVTYYVYQTYYIACKNVK